MLFAHYLPAQNLVSPTLVPGADSPRSSAGVNADGTQLAANAQNSAAAIDQARLYQRTTSSSTAGVTADGTALPDSDASEPSDDSFGTQQILKTQEPARDWVLGGDASVFYTSNAALTRRGEISDSFGVANAALSWTHPLGKQFSLQLGGRTSLFRYNETSELDFESLGAGVGLAWSPPRAPGLSLFLRYDFTELLDSGSDEILRDHEWTLGTEKTIVLGRAHAVSFGLIGMAGLSNPHSAQRDQMGAFATYHLQLARNLDADLLYRFGYYFYNQGGRRDRNQVFSASLNYHLANWIALGAFFSLGNNRSTVSVFDYDVLSTGGGLSLAMRF